MVVQIGLVGVECPAVEVALRRLGESEVRREGRLWGLERREVRARIGECGTGIAESGGGGRIWLSERGD